MRFSLREVKLVIVIGNLFAEFGELVNRVFHNFWQCCFAADIWLPVQNFESKAAILQGKRKPSLFNMFNMFQT